MPYKVIAECIDARTGKRFFPGDTFPDPTKDQAERLVKAKCIEEVSAAEARKAAKDAEDAERRERLTHLEKLSDEQLAAEAKARNLDLGKAKDRAAVIALLAG